MPSDSVDDLGAMIPMAYFDSAYVIKCYVPETGSADVRRTASRVERLVTSELCRIEFSAAIHRKRREQQLTKREADVVLKQFARDAEAYVWEFIPVSRAAIERVCALFTSLPSTVSLRSADAIHLVTAAELGLTEIFSNDRQLLTGAPFLGLRGVDVIDARGDHA